MAIDALVQACNKFVGEQGRSREARANDSGQTEDFELVTPTHTPWSATQRIVWSEGHGCRLVRASDAPLSGLSHLLGSDRVRDLRGLYFVVPLGKLRREQGQGRSG